MDFEPFALHDWLSAHEGTAKYLLAHSGVRSATLRDLGVKPDVLTQGNLGYGPLPSNPDLVAKVAQVVGMPEDRVLVTLAGSEADLLAAWAVVKPGDKVVVENPTYTPIHAVPKALGAKVTLHQRTWTNKFRLDLAKLEDQLKGVKLFSFTNLHNPTGVGATRRELEELHDIAERRKCTVLVDEAFRELAWDPPPIAATLGDRFVSAHTLTKSYGLAGLRTGWLLGSTEIVARARVAKSHVSIGQAVIEERLALVALDRRDVLLKRAAQMRDEGYAKVKPWLQGHPMLEWVEPDGGVIVAPRLPSGVDDMDLARKLVKDRNTLVVPASVQGLKGHLRLGFGGDVDHLEPGLRNIDELLSRETGRPFPVRAPSEGTSADGPGAREDDLLEDHMGSKGGDV